MLPMKRERERERERKKRELLTRGILEPNTREGGIGLWDGSGIIVGGAYQAMLMR